MEIMELKDRDARFDNRAGAISQLKNKNSIL
jgi:hypothetical protein